MSNENFSPIVQKWTAELDDAEKREKDWRKSAANIVDIYEGKKKENFQFNILYANTETLSPALYNSVPRPVVSRRFKDNDPVGLQASLISKRILQYLMDENGQECATYDSLMKSAVLESLVPGRGLSRFTYVPKFKAKVEKEPSDPQETEGGDDERELIGETIEGKEVPWDKFLMGYAKKWQDVPWIAFIHEMSKLELVENFGDLGKSVPVLAPTTGEDSVGHVYSHNDMAGVKFATVYEIWDKESRHVFFICKDFGQVLKDVPDPLELQGFYPCPKPLMLFSKISDLVPVPLYLMYEEQAKELNRITVRINKLVSAMKIRGMYDASLDGIEKVLQSEDNTLVPAENVASMQQGQTLERAIWLMPITPIVSALQQLYMQRDSVKAIIYEITGIADIMRGASAASETLGAQQLKSQWGTLRQKKMQKAVMAYTRDCMRIMLEIAVNTLSPQTMQQMTNVNLQTAEEKAALQQHVNMMQSQPQMPGQPPAPPAQIPPEIQQQLSMPTWEDVQLLFKNNLLRNYRIDIETNSTVDLEATEDKEDMGALLNALSQFFSGIGPLVMNGSMPFGAAKAILMMVTRRYRFGDEVEEQLEQMQMPKPQQPPQGAPGPSPAELQANAAKAQVATQVAQTQLQSESIKQINLQQEFEYFQARHAARMQEITQQAIFAEQAHQAKLREIQGRSRNATV